MNGVRHQGDEAFYPRGQGLASYPLIQAKTTFVKPHDSTAAPVGRDLIGVKAGHRASRCIGGDPGVNKVRDTCCIQTRIMWILLDVACNECVVLHRYAPFCQVARSLYALPHPSIIKGNVSQADDIWRLIAVRPGWKRTVACRFAPACA